MCSSTKMRGEAGGVGFCQSSACRGPNTGNICMACAGGTPHRRPRHDLCLVASFTCCLVEVTEVMVRSPARRQLPDYMPRLTRLVATHRAVAGAIREDPPQALDSISQTLAQAAKAMCDERFCSEFRPCAVHVMHVEKKPNWARKRLPSGLPGRCLAAQDLVLSPMFVICFFDKSSLFQVLASRLENGSAASLMLLPGSCFGPQAQKPCSTGASWS